MKPNLLIDSLPDCVEIDGKDYRIHPDHKTVIRVLLILQDPVFFEEECRQMSLSLFYEDKPSDERQSFQAMMDFIRCYQEKEVDAEETVFDFEIDSDLIFSAFFRVYGLDLTEVKIHWFKFIALFADIHHEIPMLSSLIQIRTAELLPKMSDQQKLRLLWLKKKYRIRKESDTYSSNAELADRIMKGGKKDAL